MFENLIYFLRCPQVMASFLPLIFQPNKRTPQEKQTFDLLQKAKFGEHLEDLAHINGGKGWITFLDGFDNTSWYRECPIFHTSFFSSESYISKEDYEICKKNFKSFSSCLHYTAIEDGQDPLKVSKLYHLNEFSARKCFQVQDACFNSCGRVRLEKYMDIRTYELFFARLRRNFLSKTGDLREDLGLQRYPNTVFSMEDLVKMRKTNQADKPIYEKITDGDFDFSYNFNLPETQFKMKEYSQDGKNYLHNVFPLEGRSQKEKDLDARRPPNSQNKNLPTFDHQLGAGWKNNRYILGSSEENEDENGTSKKPKLTDLEHKKTITERGNRFTRFDNIQGYAEKARDNNKNKAWDDEKYWNKHNWHWRNYYPDYSDKRGCTDM